MSHTPHSDRDFSWMAAAWLVAIASGASATGLLRTAVGTSNLGPAILAGHAWFGTAVGLLILVRVVRGRERRGWLPALSAVALVLGWFASRSFAPLTVAAHAAAAAFASVALVPQPAGTSFTESAAAIPARHRTWTPIVARLGLLLMLLQAALGALLRHRLIGLEWHILAGGLATLAVLVPAVAVIQDEAAATGETAAARWAIGSLVLQVTLGVAVLSMILGRTANAPLWLLTTIAHVVCGSLALIAVARLALVLGAPPAR